MTSAGTPSRPHHHQPTSPPQAQNQAAANVASPPTKRDLKSWWKRFQVQSKNPEIQEPKPQGIFGVPLRQSITYANVAISLVDENGISYIYGYVPIVVAKCGVFLKEKATSVEGIFRLSGSEKRIKELKTIFDSPDRYGKGLVWDGYTVHDAANVLRRYLNDLPEPVVPLDLYEKFRDPLRGNTRQGTGDNEGTHLVENFDEQAAIVQYQNLIKNLPHLNRQLLLYILDLLAVFAAKADENRMTAQNLAAIFQPGMLSHPAHAMAPEEYRLNQCVIIFLIENQDHFLIGMQGTAADEQTRQDIEKGTPPVASPVTPNRKSGVARSASNASAGAESISRDGVIRRNRSTSSRHSRHSNGNSTPNSPALATTPTGGLARSNTVPSKKSPHVQSRAFPRQDASGHLMAQTSPTAGVAAAAPPTVTEESTIEQSAAVSAAAPIVTASSMLTPGAATAGRSQERLLEVTPEVATPSKERNLTVFQRSPTDSDKRTPNKLRKKKMPGSANLSAQSSTVSLPQSGPVSPAVESFNALEQKAPQTSQLEPVVPENGGSTETPSEPTPRASQVPSASALPSAPDHSHNQTLKPKTSPQTSLHSSFNEGSDIDTVEPMNRPPQANPASTEPQEKERKRFFRMSRRKEDVPGAQALASQNLGVNSHAEASTSSVGSGYHQPRKSWTGDSSDVANTLVESESGGREGKEEARGPLGWIRNKIREKDDHKRTKSPPGDNPTGILNMRGKSIDLKRGPEENQAAAAAAAHPPAEATPEVHAPAPIAQNIPHPPAAQGEAPPPNPQQTSS